VLRWSLTGIWYLMIDLFTRSPAFLFLLIQSCCFKDRSHFHFNVSKLSLLFESTQRWRSDGYKSPRCFPDFLHFPLSKFACTQWKSEFIEWVPSCHYVVAKKKRRWSKRLLEPEPVRPLGNRHRIAMRVITIPVTLTRCPVVGLGKTRAPPPMSYRPTIE